MGWRSEGGTALTVPPWWDAATLADLAAWRWPGVSPCCTRLKLCLIRDECEHNATTMGFSANRYVIASHEAIHETPVANFLTSGPTPTNAFHPGPMPDATYACDSPSPFPGWSIFISSPKSS